MIIDIEEFKTLAENALYTIPDLFLSKIDNVCIEVVEEPRNGLLECMGGSKSSILGLYQGIPLLKRGIWYGTYPAVPDRIILFKKNIESVCKNRDELIKTIRAVIIHEIGHHFGMSESEIRSAMQ